MSKRAASSIDAHSTVSSISKKVRDDILHDDPLDGENDFPELAESDSASQISMQPSHVVSNEEMAAPKPIRPIAVPQMDSFRNVFRDVMSANGQSGLSNDASSSQSDQLRSLNDKLKPVSTENVDMSVIDRISKSFDEVPIPRLTLSEKRDFNCWLILRALKSPSNVIDSENANFAAIDSLYKQMMKSYAKAEEFLEDMQKLPEDLEIELHLAASKYFKCLLLFNNTAQPKHLKAMLAGRSFILFDTISPNLQHLLKTSLNFQLNENFDQGRDIDRRNPLFKMEGWGIILVRPRPSDRRFFELQPDCAEYMSDIFRSVCSQRIKEDNGPNNREMIHQVWFNLVNRRNVPSIPALDSGRLKKFDKDLQLCHVTMNDAYILPSKNNQLVLVVVLYVNYFLTTSGFI